MKLKIVAGKSGVALNKITLETNFIRDLKLD